MLTINPLSEIDVDEDDDFPPRIGKCIKIYEPLRFLQRTRQESNLINFVRIRGGRAQPLTFWLIGRTYCAVGHAEVAFAVSVVLIDDSFLHFVEDVHRHVTRFTKGETPKIHDFRS